MERTSAAAVLLDQEARALLTRVRRMKPYALHESMVPAAAISPAAQSSIEHCLANGRSEARRTVRGFIEWLAGPDALAATAEDAQRRFTYARMRFNTILSEFDLFADALTQRSEEETGVWLAGLDILATDALALDEGYFVPPPVICYLDRGPGAAIRRARTRLPGGADNPVAIVRVPRERMVGSAIASSIVHEVGHQASALLDIHESLRAALGEIASTSGEHSSAWKLYQRWISEIVADFWSVARLGITSTLGLTAVVSLPRPFVFRLSIDDPHPIPWVRVKISCAIGEKLFPHPQWKELSDLWEELYPIGDLPERYMLLLNVLIETLPAFVETLCSHRPAGLRGKTLAEVMLPGSRTPEALGEHYRRWQFSPSELRTAPPSLVFAVFGQARAEGRISPEAEGRLLSTMLRFWAVERTFTTAGTTNNETKVDLCRCHTHAS